MDTPRSITLTSVVRPGSFKEFRDLNVVFACFIAMILFNEHTDRYLLSGFTQILINNSSGSQVKLGNQILSVRISSTRFICVLF
jgi:hypothetical protein